ncbi:MAG: hypothetical protein M1831_003715 [Alyxoria varia]|nr:MAG: hypothetical protein M1831_003715 [Alyxoria varia]
MGRYRAPSTLDPSLTAPSSTGLPSTKARRLNSSIKDKTPASRGQTIRFEMPFHILCSTCPSTSTSAPIGQGVRFNALKTRAGNYFSTPIWNFRMKHPACGGWIELRTDPKNADFVVTEGARRRDFGGGEDEVGNEGGYLEEAESEMPASMLAPRRGPGGRVAVEDQKREDAFAALEGKTEKKKKDKTQTERLEELWSLKERDWKDVDASGRRARDAFRVGRRQRQRDAAQKETVQESMGLGIELLDENESDRKRAAAVEFGDTKDSVRGGQAASHIASAAKPLFASSAGTSRALDSKRGHKTRAQIKAESQLQSLKQELSGNTRAAIDPFSVSTDSKAERPNGKKESIKVPQIASRSRRPASPVRESPSPNRSSSNPNHAPNISSNVHKSGSKDATLVPYSSEDDRAGAHANWSTAHNNSLSATSDDHTTANILVAYDSD